MKTMRAKMIVCSVEVSEFENPTTGQKQTTMESLTLAAVTEKPFDPDGKSEDNDFARWTPSGSLTLSITNPVLFGQFKAGQKFYVDFSEAAE